MQNAVGSAVNDIARVADDAVEGLRHTHLNHQHEHRGRNNQEGPQHQRHTGFPFAFGRPSAVPAQGQQSDNHVQQECKAPPASSRAIRQLPEIIVRPEDLVDENNRECCICLDR